MSEFDPSKVPADDFCTETHIFEGEGPEGSRYSVATYLDKFRHPCVKEKACYVGIVCYDAEYKPVLCVDGTCGEEENRKFTDEEIKFYTNVKKAYNDVCLGKSVRISCHRYGLPQMDMLELSWKYREGHEAHII